MNNVAVCWLTQETEDLPADLSWLGKKELEVLAGLKVAKRRKDWLLGRWTGKLALRHEWWESINWSDFEILAAEDGAPEAFLQGDRAPLSLSLSHSDGKGFCVIQFAGIPVGCDVQKVEARSENFVMDYFVSSEIERVFAAPAAMQPLFATLIWSAKESALKAKREGLRLDTRQVVVDFETGPDPEDWQPLRVKDEANGKVYPGFWREEDEWVYSVVAEQEMELEEL